VTEEDSMYKHNLIRRWLTGGVVIAAASFPSAAQAMLPLADPPAATSGQVASAIGLPVPHAGSRAQSGFEWGDAGIGAAGTIVLLGAGAVASGVGRRRRAHRTIVG
jgi:hypothetical protein